ncbi:glycerol-3-phosphate dehydrogenase [Massilia glaciei]|nr:glycerol-3-phosphate dehydrogenase [Massilia glaciei]
MRGEIECDLLVIGGGINGAGIARDAAGRGLSVVLCERDDLARHTSSASTKLIHGGLRYLEHYEFGLVRKALREREVLLRVAPHIISPLRFVLPRLPGGRPAWMIRAGLFLYDRLARRELLPASAALRLDKHEAGAALKGGCTQAFAYSDAWVDDARLVVLNALDAKERGATILTGTRCAEVVADGGAWRARLEGRHACTVRAKVVVNAAGPWAGQVAQMGEAGQAGRSVRLVKGSHIVVPRLFSHKQAYLFQHADGRVVFAIPYQGDFTLIGTTDLAYAGDPAAVAIDDGEVAYLCTLANQCFRKQIGRKDVVWSYSGVRPLLDDGTDNPSAVTRDYLLEWAPGAAPMLHVWGGKITTYRKLAEHALEMVAGRLGKAAAGWTETAFLPGGDIAATVAEISPASFEAFLASFRALHPWLAAELAQRYARSYGTRAVRFLAGTAGLRDLGELVAPGLYERELRYLVDVEWASCADDVLWRRTKQGLRCGPDDRIRLERWIEAYRAGTSAPEPGAAAG